MSIFKKDFYDIADFIKDFPDALYYVTVSARGPGKTTSALKYALEKYCKDGSTTCLLRRWEDDIKGSHGQDIWTFINGSTDWVEKASHNKWNKVTVRSRKCYLVKADENGIIIDRDDTPFMHLLALTQSEHYKGLSFSSEDHPCNTIIYDEIYPQHGTSFLVDEGTIFMNVLSTIIRQRKGVKILCLGNTIGSGYNPILNLMGIDITEMEIGERRLYQFGAEGKTQIAVEYLDKNKFKKQESNIYFCFDNPKMRQITGGNEDKYGSWELQVVGTITNCDKYRPKDVIFKYFILWKDHIYQADIVTTNSKTYTFIHETNHKLEDGWLKEDKEIIFAPEFFDARPNWSRTGLKRPTNKLQQKIVSYFKTDKVYYQDNWVGSNILTMLDNCDNIL